MITSLICLTYGLIKKRSLVSTFYFVLSFSILGSIAFFGLYGSLTSTVFFEIICFFPFLYFRFTPGLNRENYPLNTFVFITTIVIGIIYGLDMTSSVKELLISQDFAMQRVMHYQGDIKTYNSMLGRICGIISVYLYPLFIYNATKLESRSLKLVTLIFAALPIIYMAIFTVSRGMFINLLLVGLIIFQNSNVVLSAVQKTGVLLTFIFLVSPVVYATLIRFEGSVLSSLAEYFFIGPFTFHELLFEQINFQFGKYSLDGLPGLVAFDRNSVGGNFGTNFIPLLETCILIGVGCLFW